MTQGERTNMADKSALHHALPIFLAGICNLALFFASTCRGADLYIGSNASGVTTNVTSGTNSYDSSYVGFTATDSNNTLNVLNVGTLLANTSGIYVGYDGSGNSLVISNGGTVANADGYIGGSILSSNNNVLVTGTNSLWTNSGILYVGLFGSGNTLTIANEGSVAAASISLGASNGSSGTLNIGSLGGSDAGGTITAGSIDGGLGTGTINFNQTNNVTVTSTITGANLSVNKLGTGTVTLSGASYSGGTLVSVGALAGSTGGLQGNITNNGTVIFDQGTNGSYAGMLSGSGVVNKAGAGAVTFTGDSSYTGSTWIQFGTLNLNAALGAAKNTTSVSVSTNATLLISQSQQVNNSAAITLSGGTIQTASGVTETFGALNLTTGSFLNFGAVYGSGSSMNFGAYAPTQQLSINNFDFGSTLTFKSDLSSTINTSSLFTFTNGGISSSSWNGSTFTITAIPEASTSTAGLALLAFGAWVFISTTPRFFLPLRLRRWKAAFIPSFGK